MPRLLHFTVRFGIAPRAKTFLEQRAGILYKSEESPLITKLLFMQRIEHMGLWERLYFPEVFRGLMVTGY
ncbi:MAG TPA: hypothetical protein VGA73_14995, partial [Candidatus Binatia bacterium]